jgi:hypothetical protein
MNIQWAGLAFAVTTFTTIGFGHVLVRRLHPLFGTRLGIPLIALGVLILILSMITTSDLLSGILGIVAVTSFWDGIEFFRQQKRVQREQ